jgi:hypothetical protein
VLLESLIHLLNQVIEMEVGTFFPEWNVPNNIKSDIRLTR